MTTSTFVKDAIRTESQIEKITVNPFVFRALVDTIISAGTVLDQIKKNVFYKKPFKISEIQDKMATAREAIDAVTFLMHDQEFPNPAFDKDVEVNPRIFHSVVGIVTEAVELLQAIDLNSREVDTVNLLEEFGDLAWYQAIGIDEAGGTFEQVLDRVIAKLRARYPEKFTNENAINRDLAKERKVLEGNAPPMLKDLNLQ